MLFFGLLFTLFFTLLFTLLFKRQAPNDMKKGNLIAKCWIITDLGTGSIINSAASRRDACDS
jgi:hypothetical protein